MKQTLYTVSQKTVQNYFCQNFVKFPPTVKVLGTKMAKGISGALIFHLTYFKSTLYRVKRRCSKLLHNAVIISLP